MWFGLGGTGHVGTGTGLALDSGAQPYIRPAFTVHAVMWICQLSPVGGHSILHLIPSPPAFYDRTIWDPLTPHPHRTCVGTFDKWECKTYCDIAKNNVNSHILPDSRSRISPPDGTCAPNILNSDFQWIISSYLKQYIYCFYCLWDEVLWGKKISLSENNQNEGGSVCASKQI